MIIENDSPKTPSIPFLPPPPYSDHQRVKFAWNKMLTEVLKIIFMDQIPNVEERNGGSLVTILRL